MEQDMLATLYALNPSPRQDLLLLILQRQHNWINDIIDPKIFGSTNMLSLLMMG